MALRPTRNLMIAALAGAAMVVTVSAAEAQTPVKVMVFPGLSNLSIFAAQHKNLHPQSLVDNSSER